jgi:lipopolysaccharide export system protein LptA
MLFRSFVVIATLLAAVYYFHIRLTSEDAKHYENLLLETSRIREKRVLKNKTATQERLGVTKDIWMDNGAKHIKIKSENSSVSLSESDNHVAFVEELHSIKALLPEGYELQAESGSYLFPSNQFIAQGNCVLTQENNRIECEQICFNFHQKQMTCKMPVGKFDEKLDFSAQEMILDKKANKLFLKTDVKLISFSAGKKSFALADRLTYHLIDKTIDLSSDEKVLVWQDDLNLSASQVLIQTDSETIEGKGDVHFSFSLEEQNKIDEFFKHYL